MDSSLEGFRAGQKVARISVLTLVGIGVAEVIIGIISGSVVAFADGIDSFGDATISFIVWLGLLMSQKFGVRSRRFHPADVLDWIRRGAPTRLT